MKHKKKILEFAVESNKFEYQDKIMENWYVMFQIKEVLNFQRFLLWLANQLS